MISRETHIITAVKISSDGETTTHHKVAYHSDTKQMIEDEFCSLGFLVSTQSSYARQCSILDHSNAMG